MMAHLPVLQVVAPLMIAPVCAVTNRGHWPWALATSVAWLAFAISIGLLIGTADGTSLRYEIGSWAAPWGIEYVIDRTNAFVLFVVSGIGAVVASYARQSVIAEIDAEHHGLYYTAFLLCLTGLLGITATGDAFNVFVFLEISSLSSYALIAMGRDRRAITAAYQYLIMGTIGATFILIGIGFLYMMTGTLNMADLAERIPAVSKTRTVHAAFAFITVGVALKLAVFPLHLWLPNAYSYAPSIATAFLAATATKVALYVLLRFFYTVFGGDFSFDLMQLDWVLLPLSLIAIVAASLVAIFQENVKRILAYSSVAQIGYMTLGLSMDNLAGLTASIVHLFNHALMKGGLFLALGCVAYRCAGSCNLKHFAGLGRQMPWTMAAFVAGGLSLIGVPLSAGFISKWYLILGALDNGWWPVAALILVTSLLAVVYIWRVVEAAYFKTAATDAQPLQEAPLSMLIPTWFLIAANYFFGSYSTLSSGSAQAAAAQLLGIAP